MLDRLTKWGRRGFVKTYFLAFMLLSSPVLFAADADAKPKEPVWVMSWAVFIFFIGILIAILAHSRMRFETQLSGEDKKQNEEELAAKIQALRLEEKKRRREERRRQDGD